MGSRRTPGKAAFVLLAWLAGAAGAAAQETPAAAPLRNFDATQLTTDRYTVVGRLWVESWLTAFDVARHREAAAAIAELSAEAVRLGADAITNVTCLNDQGGAFNRGYFCYALAVKLKSP